MVTMANTDKLQQKSSNSPTSVTMGGECRMAGVAVATPTLPVPQQHFALLSLMATPTLTCWLTILCFGHTNFGNHPPPMSVTDRSEYGEGCQFTVIGCHISTLPENTARSGDSWEIAKPLRP